MKKTISILLSLLLLGVFPVSALAIDKNEVTTPAPLIIVPRYAYISSISAGLDIDSGGYATCSGTVVSLTASTADLTVTLMQYKDKKWQNYDEWTTSGTAKYGVSLSKSRYVVSGYKYKVVVTASVYDANGKLLETQSKESSVKSY